MLKKLAIAGLVAGCGGVEEAELTKENSPYTYVSACGSLADEAAWPIVRDSEAIALKHFAGFYKGDACAALAGVRFTLLPGTEYLQKLEGNRVLLGATYPEADGVLLVTLSDLPIQFNAYGHEVMHVLDYKLDKWRSEGHEEWEADGKYAAIEEVSHELN